MNGFEYFIWLAKQSFDIFVFWGWPFVLPTLLVLVITLCVDIRKRHPHVADFALSLLPLLGPMLILASGVIFQKKPDSGNWAFVGLVLCLVLCVVVIVKLKRMRATTLVVSLLIVWYSLCCLFLAAMSISDDWL